MTPEPVFEGLGRYFVGFAPRRCFEHRTVGSHRAWCHECRTWCYPDDPCNGCATDD